jgi:hypothetical protein
MPVASCQSARCGLSRLKAGRILNKQGTSCFSHSSRLFHLMSQRHELPMRGSPSGLGECTQDRDKDKGESLA